MDDLAMDPGDRDKADAVARRKARAGRSVPPLGATGGGGDPASAGEGTSTRVPPGGRRHLGRMLAFQVVYEVDVTDHPVAEVLARTFEEQDPPAAIRDHVERLVGGSLAAQGDIDPYIAAAAPAFPVAQLASVDRNVLRLAIFELLRQPDVPPKVAINEAVELAKRFGGDNSGRFVNGVLGTVSQRIAAAGDGGAAGQRDGGRAEQTDDELPSEAG